MGTRFAAMAAVALAAATAAGCGSSDDKGPTKADFVKQANGICAKGNEEIEAGARKLFAGSKGRPSKAAIAKFVGSTAIPEIQKQVDALKKLDPPEGDEGKVKQITDAADAGLAKVKANPLSATREGPKDPFAKADKLAGDYGLEACDTR